ncbi:alpha/beta fold hydrolase [Metallibacterium sp.]|uniref:alpha/beta hydrolase family protein n=1 Tax=Metallibacterium sp. TaxID=2940281 RepID=UPI002613A011|nr:alpha/beta fold hydrolase [Metallibacterium sp.]
MPSDQEIMTTITLSSAPRLIPVRAADGATAQIGLVLPDGAQCGLLWLPAMGVAARHYAPLAVHCGEQGIACAVHEWRGIGSSSLRAARARNWGYRELLRDIGTSFDAARAATPGLSWLLGGHSLGGQLALLFISQVPAPIGGLALIGSGTPYWRNFRWPLRWPLRAAFTLAPLVAGAWGYYPGRHLGFGGNESRGVIRDWTHSARSGRYCIAGQAKAAEAALVDVRQPVLVLHARDDRLVPQAAIDHLLAKLPNAPREQVQLDAADFGTHSVGHFGWMQAPQPVARAIAAWAMRLA